MSKQRWRVTWFDDMPGVVHVSPDDDTYEHRTEPDGECWCNPWREQTEYGVIVHHPDLTERMSVLRAPSCEHRRYTTAVKGLMRRWFA